MAMPQRDNAIEEIKRLDVLWNDLSPASTIPAVSGFWSSSDER